MKSKRPVFKSFRKKILYKPKGDVLQPNIRHGETLIPTGGTPTVISLPKTVNTFTYDIINTDRLSSDLTLATTEGTLKGLILNTDQGNLSIDPVALGTRQLQFASTIKDGSYISTLSDGADWFIWSFGIGQGLAQSTNKRPANTPPSSGFIGSSIGGNLNSIVQSVQYTSVSIDNSDVTVDFPGGSAEHDISIDGSAHPSTASLPVIIKVFTPGDIFVTDINVATDGSWNFSAENLGNGNHEFIFKQFIGGTQVNSAVSWNRLLDGGSLEFDCPTIEIEVGTNSPDFTVFPTVQHVDLSGVVTPIPVSVKSTTYTSSKAEDDTFNVVFEYDFDGVTYEQTIDGVVVNLVQPAEPTISTVGGNASNVAISTPIADIVGTANPNATVQVWIDGIPNTPIGTVTADGIGEWTISSHDFGFTMNQTVIIKAQQQTAGGSLWSNSSTDFLVRYEQNVLSEPTITSLVADLTTFSTGDYSNKSNPFTINGTGIAGSEITLNGATALGGTITVAGDGTWTTTTNLSHDATHDITAQATKAGFTQSQQSTAFQLNVDRTAPTFGTINDITLFLGNVTDSLPTANDSFDPNGVTVTPSYSPSLASVEGDYVATYTATDRAGNSTTATDARIITVTTEPIVPVITSITANSDGTFTVAGTVTGTYADNLTVQVTIGGSDSGSPVNVIGEAFTHRTDAQSPGTYQFNAKTINSVGGESSLINQSSSGTIAVPDTEKPVITLVGAASVSFTEGDSYADDGATALDNVDGIITNQIVTTIVDASGNPAVLDSTTVPGIYTIKYNVSDSAIPTPNAADEVTRTVTVESAFSFIEDLQSVIDRANNAPGDGRSINTQTGVGVVGSNNRQTGINVDLGDDGLVTYDSNGVADDSNWTLSFWIKRNTANESNANLSGIKHFFGRHQLGNANDPTNALALAGGFTATHLNSLNMRIEGATAPFHLTSTNNFTQDPNFGNTGIPIVSDYANFIIVSKVRTDNKVDIECYVNGIVAFRGNHLARLKGLPIGTQVLPDADNQRIAFGGTIGSRFVGPNPGKSIMCEVESIQLVTGISLNSVGAAALFAGGTTTTISDANQTPTPPEITLFGDVSMFHELGTTFTDPGFVATDQQDGTITNSVVQVIRDSNNNVISSIDANTPYGYYTITYTVTDSAGATVSATRDVEVNVSGLFLEEFASARQIGTGNQNPFVPGMVGSPLPTINQGVFFKSSGLGATEVNLKDEGVFTFNNNEPVNSNFTFSFWVRPEQDMGTGFQNIMGKVASGAQGAAGAFSMAISKDSNGKARFKPSLGTNSYGMGTGSQAANLTATSTRDFVAGTWYHMAITYELNSSTQLNEFKVYIDGTLGNSKLNIPPQHSLIAEAFGRANNGNFSHRFGIGLLTSSSKAMQNNSTISLSLDSIQFGDNVVLTANQILAIYNQSDRRMSIDDASQI